MSAVLFNWTQMDGFFLSKKIINTRILFGGHPFLNTLDEVFKNILLFEHLQFILTHQNMENMNKIGKP